MSPAPLIISIDQHFTISIPQLLFLVISYYQLILIHNLYGSIVILLGTSVSVSTIIIITFYLFQNSNQILKCVILTEDYLSASSLAPTPSTGAWWLLPQVVVTR